MDERELAFETMVSYVLGELDPAAAETIRRALLTDALAADIAQQLKAAIDTMRHDDSATPARALVDRARALIRTNAEGAGAAMARRVAEEAAGWWSRAVDVAAALVFDSRAQTAHTGFRGGAMGRQLAYRTDDSEIDVAVTEGPGGAWTILGQVEPAGGGVVESVAVAAPGAAQAAAAAVPDRSGVFKIHTTLPEVELRVLIGGRVVGLGTVNLE